MPEHPPVTSTYRLQLGPEFGFAAASATVEYVAGLGVSHLYLSPVLTARPGSTHGYDVTDPTAVSAALGGEPALRELAAQARRRGLGLVVDIVPNHLGTGADTPLWDALLAQGKGSVAGTFFDVAWESTPPGSEGKIILPVLGASYGQVLHAGELGVAESDRGPRVRYHRQTFPLSDASREALSRAGGVEAVRGVPGEPETWARLHALLEEQHYRLVHWRAGRELVNYRRFFAIDELAGVRVEDAHVFDATHAKILELVSDGVVDGLRVDHPDGLRDPGGYLERLAQAAPRTWTVVEKIVQPGEALPDWPVAGTTGYEFANDVLGLFVDPAAETRFDELDAWLGACGWGYERQVRAAKYDVLAGALAADVARLNRRLWVRAQADLHARDVGFDSCLEALSAVLVGLDVYRTYVDPDTGEVGDDDRRRAHGAVESARRSNAASAPLLDLLSGVLSGRDDDPEARELLARFQQLSGALTAKGVEDTAFYRHRRLLALNEVGGDPSRFGLPVAGFHASNAERADRHPGGMLATMTHDTKRGEDVRLRIAALTHLPEGWEALLRRHVTGADGQVTQLVLQTLVGVWPLQGSPDATLTQRVVDYCVKASREAGLETDWTDPDPAFEGALSRFVRGVLADAEFSADLATFARQVQEVAMAFGLAQTLLRVTSPGVPDTYQGCELWEDSLVDPDNRRPVDFGARARLLAELDDGADPAELWARRRDGRVKLWVLSRALRTRAAHAACFEGGAYEPLDAGAAAVAFARSGAGDTVVTVASRRPAAVGEAALDLEGPWEDVLTGTRHQGPHLAVGRLCATLPVALLARP